jgi:hypothetical protein
VAVFVELAVGNLVDNGEQLGNVLEENGEPAVKRAADAGRLRRGRGWRGSVGG